MVPPGGRSDLPDTADPSPLVTLLRPLAGKSVIIPSTKITGDDITNDTKKKRRRGDRREVQLYRASREGRS